MTKSNNNIILYKMPYGNFYYGKDGFFFKKMTGGSVRHNPSIGLICNQPQDVNNRYVSGSGVGASNIANRRAKLLHASKYKINYQAGQIISRLGLYPILTPLHPLG